MSVDPRVDDVTDRLVSVLGERVHRPGTPGYRASLDGVFFPDASRRSPVAVVHPRDVQDVASVMRTAAHSGDRVTVRGGGLSSNCVDDSAVMIDLSVHMADVAVRGDRVVVQGGATVGAALAAVAPHGRAIPVGIVGLAGMGLITRGGVGYLTREVGLALDQLVEVELVLPGGRVVRLSQDSVGEDADLWWAVRGCAPPFGVVTSVVMRTVEQGPVFVDRLVTGTDALATYFAEAPKLPRHTTMGAVLGYVPGGSNEPVLLVYTACRSQDPADIDVARAATSRVAESSTSVGAFRSETSGRYLDGLPQFSIPGPHGEEPAPITLPEPGADRGWFYGKSVFTGPTLGPVLADGLVEAIGCAPTKFCRIDFQHTGGALGDVGDSDTAFFGRGGEWNVPLNAIWSDASDGDACYEWARRTLRVLAPETMGVYSVEVRPGFEETERETASAFGPNLIRLRELRRRYDPTGVLAVYPL
ncbi:FAD-linked oxidase [Mycolicibacterium madagascariense]|uniref:FAD-linked oxidase n=1 Tax=Mycolicibacterium madagascariense TaxID=212765 RepID=A0A7I7XE31_9MYCO|nr:FAD-binding oxidoreductase [Mycolicibacterium madagascariense]MCV7011735.1 FAD-binding oxidoreductase [Mycolicibacterium madagascariense]BBZ27373.1 FAD-linked oxidase [Mycolicibacterium madagascariense]